MDSFTNYSLARNKSNLKLTAIKSTGSKLKKKWMQN